IEAVVNDVNKGIDTAAGEATKAQDDYKKLREAQAGQDAAAEQKGLAPAAVKKAPAEKEKQGKDVKAVGDQADKAEGVDEYAAMYFLLTEARSAAADIKVPTADEYKQQVDKAAKEAEAAAAAAAANKSKVEEAKAGATAKAKAL